MDREGQVPGARSGGNVWGMASSPKPSAANGAVFVDLDRTLLRGASGLVLSAAMHAEGLFEGRPSIPGERLIYGLYDLRGESLPFMGLARAAARFVKGWPVETMKRAGQMAAAELADLVQPYAPAVLAEHRRAGRILVLATTTPVDLIEPFARLFGFDHILATRYSREDGHYTGGIDGNFVWSRGKLAASRAWAEAEGVDLADCHAYSDSVFDLPLLRAVGHPHAVNPDSRLRGLARLNRWPIEHWDRPPGVPKLVGMEAYDVLRHIVRPELFPYARFDIGPVGHFPARGPVLLASNHRSYFDVAALAVVAARLHRPVRFLGKQELFDAPVVGQLARALGGIPVDRKGEPAVALAEARKALDAGEVVAILPQGTIPRGRAFFDPVLQGKTGTARLAASGIPVVPVAVWGTEAVWPRSSRMPNMVNLLHPPTVHVRMGDPLTLDSGDPHADTERLMTAIAALLPEELRRPHEPSPQELALTVPAGRGE